MSNADSYHQMYIEAIKANRELGGKDVDVPQPFMLSALEKFHFDVLVALKEHQARKAEVKAHLEGTARKATVKAEE